MAFDQRYARQFANAFSNSNLQLILFPTEQCNFRCTYCYEDFALGRMSDEIISGVKNLIAKRKDLKHLNIMWFGGEPTAALDIVLDISTFAKNFCDQNG